ncbi:MAG: T9SS type A sorting domain-containing protein [Bacteroidota bacterium]
MTMRSMRAWINLGVLTLGLAALGGNTAALAQAPVLGDDFVFFINGSNVLIPEVAGGTVVNDPLAPGTANKVIAFANANFAEPGWAWPAAVGVDASQNVGAGIGEGDTLYIRVLSDPANRSHNAGFGPHSAMRIQFTDSQENDSDLANGNPAFRVSWVFPEWVHDGQWHELAIPLPPTTTAVLDSMRLDKDANGAPLPVPADELAKRWWYNGAWTSAGGITPPSASLFGGTNPDRFQEFSWDAVKRFGVSFDWADAGSTGAPVYFDYFYIGGPHIAIDALAGGPAPMRGVTATAEEGSFKVSWMHDPQFAGYNVYASDRPITDVTDPLVLQIGQKNFEDTDFSVTYNHVAPHTTLASDFTVYFAVTSVGAFGEENTDVTNSRAQATTTVLSKPHLFEVTDEESDTIFDNLDAGNVVGGPLVGTYVPFAINSGRYREGNGGPPERLLEDRDLSMKLWAGFHPDFEEVYLYVEVMDDTISATPEGSLANDAWRYDSVEINWGMYEPISAFIGSRHERALTGSQENRGAEPDYQLRLVPQAIAGSQGRLLAEEGALYETFSGVGDITAGIVRADEITNAVGKTVGWKALAFIPWAVLADAGGDRIFGEAVGGSGFPTGDELKLGLMNISVNDNDDPGSNLRSNVGLWTQIPGADGNSWNSPTQWEIVAFAGNDVPYNPALVEIPGTILSNAISINVADANDNTVGLALGLADGATDSFDVGIDQLAPPSPPTGSFDARLRSGSDDYLRDARALGTEAATWRVIVQASAGGTPMTFTWDATTFPEQGALQLVDATGGSLVNINMRTQTSYTLTLPLNELRVVYSQPQAVTRALNQGWNLIGTPVTLEQANYLAAIPAALPNTLFTYDAAYVAPDPAELRVGVGYWLRTGAVAEASLTGVPVGSVLVTLREGWNLISGPNCAMPVGAIHDAGNTILPGTVFGFDGTYEAAEMLSPLRGYWVRASGAGTVVLDCSAVSATKDGPEPLLADLGELVLKDASGNEQRLYFGAGGAVWAEGAYTVPPRGPGASFAAAYGDGRYATLSSSAVVLSGARYPVEVTVTRVPDAGSYTLRVGGERHGLSVGANVTVESEVALGLEASGVGSEVPSTYELEQNYPNPFNPVTTFRFGVPESGAVSLRVYDVLGREVATVVDGLEVEAGWHRVEFDGSGLASGTYVYRLESVGSVSRTRRFTLLK